MKRALLLFAMLLSLWPVGFIAVGVATESSSSDPGEVTVAVPRESSDPSMPAETVTVQLQVDGETFRCPRATRGRLDTVDQRSATIELKLRAVRRDRKPLVRRINKLDELYPGKNAPQEIADEYNGLIRTARRLAARDDRLVRQYNRSVDEHNAILESECF